MRTTFCVGGIGSAKSFNSQIWDIYRSLQNGVPLREAKPSISWTVAPNYRICETLMELTLQVAQSVFGMAEGEHFDLRRSFPRVIDFRKCGLNHRLVFLSAANPEHFVSSSITHWRWSEVGVSKALTYEKLQDRLRDKRAKVLQGLGDGSPEGYNHFFDWAGFIGNRREALDEAKNIRVFRTETGDNIKNLAPGYLEALRARYAYSNDLILSYEKGIFTNLRRSGMAYHEYFPSRNVCEPVEPDPALPLIFCWDFNVSPLAHVTMQRRWVQDSAFSPRREQYIAIAESSGECRGLMDGVAEFAATFPVSRFRDTTIRVYGDASGYARSHRVDGSDYQAIEQALTRIGYRRIEMLAERSNPLVKDRLSKVNAILAYGKFAIANNCTRLMSSFAKTTLKEGVWQLEKPAGEDWTHYSDSVSYALHSIFKSVDVMNPNAKPVLGAA